MNDLEDIVGLLKTFLLKTMQFLRENPALPMRAEHTQLYL
jgi:hypothetical protein